MTKFEDKLKDTYGVTFSRGTPNTVKRPEGVTPHLTKAQKMLGYLAVPAAVTGGLLVQHHEVDDVANKVVDGIVAVHDGVSSVENKVFGKIADGLVHDPFESQQPGTPIEFTPNAPSHQNVAPTQGKE